MIQSVINGLDLAASAQMPVVTRHGLAELRGNAPHVYSGDGAWQLIATDNGGTFSYWRLTSPVVEVDADGPSCNNYFQATYALRLVMMVDRETCGTIQDAARSVMSAIRNADVDTALGLSPRSGVTRVQADTDSRRVFQQEFGQAGDVPPSRALVAVDVTYVAIGKPECFAPCGEDQSLLCLTISRATWDAIKACMSAGQIDAATDDLCEGGGPCDPTTVNGVESDTPTITVVQGGVEVGTLNPATGVHTVPECEPCDPRIDLRLNGGDPFKTLNLDCGLNEVDIAVTTVGGDKIGSYDHVNESIVVGPGSVSVVDTDGNTVVAPVDIKPESTGNTITAPDTIIEDQDGNPIDTVLAGGTYQVIVVSGIDGGASNTTYTNSIIQP